MFRPCQNNPIVTGLHLNDMECAACGFARAPTFPRAKRTSEERRAKCKASFTSPFTTEEMAPTCLNQTRNDLGKPTNPRLQGLCKGLARRPERTLYLGKELQAQKNLSRAGNAQSDSCDQKNRPRHQVTLRAPCRHPPYRRNSSTRFACMSPYKRLRIRRP